MSSEGVDKFILLVEVHFPRAKFAGDEQKEALWLHSMQQDLSGFDDEVLVRAAEIIRTRRDPEKHGTMFPKPAECVKACVEARKLLDLNRAPVPLLAAAKSDDWSDERLSLALDLCKSQIGKQAAREGWITRIYEFCRREMRLPNDREAQICKGEWASLMRTMDDYRKREPIDIEDAKFWGAITAFADTVIRERDDLAKRVLGPAPQGDHT